MREILRSGAPFSVAPIHWRMDAAKQTRSEFCHLCYLVFVVYKFYMDLKIKSAEKLVKLNSLHQALCFKFLISFILVACWLEMNQITKDVG